MHGHGPLRDYSSGYYSLELRATPYEGGPAIDSDLFSYIEDTVYANTTAPVWMRSSLDTSPYFRLDSGEPMPTDVIALPEEWMQDLDLPDDNQRTMFFLCKPGHAHYVSQSVLLGHDYDGQHDADGSAK